MEFSTRVGATYSNMIHAHVKGTQNHEEASVELFLEQLMIIFGKMSDRDPLIRHYILTDTNSSPPENRPSQNENSSSNHQF